MDPLTDEERAAIIKELNYSASDDPLAPVSDTVLLQWKADKERNKYLHRLFNEEEARRANARLFATRNAVSVEKCVTDPVGERAKGDDAWAKLLRDVFEDVLINATKRCPLLPSPIMANARAVPKVEEDDHLPPLSNLAAVRRFLLYSVESWWQASYIGGDTRQLPDDRVVRREVSHSFGSEYASFLVNDRSHDRVVCVIRQQVEFFTTALETDFLRTLRRYPDWQKLEELLRTGPRSSGSPMEVTEYLAFHHLPDWPSVRRYLRAVREGETLTPSHLPQPTAFITSFLITNGIGFGPLWGSESAKTRQGQTGLILHHTPSHPFHTSNFRERYVLKTEKAHEKWLRNVARVAGVQMMRGDGRSNNSPIQKEPAVSLDDAHAFYENKSKTE